MSKAQIKISVDYNDLLTLTLEKVDEVLAYELRDVVLKHIAEYKVDKDE